MEKIKTDTIHLFPVLDKMLIELLTGLTAEEWQAQTVAKRWKVKDVAAHLLDGNLRGLSTSRDKYFGEQPRHIHAYQDLVDFLNDLNMSWTNAMKRVSPQLLITLLESTGKAYTEHLQSLDPFAHAVFGVAWAGQEKSYNWLHIAREYTEKFLHQQQIREAVGKQALFTKELFYPFIDTFMYALPHTFRNVQAGTGTTVSVIVTSEAGGQWNIIKNETGWLLNKNNAVNAAAIVSIDPGTAWKLFSKSITAQQAINNVQLSGDKDLGLHVLQMVAVMA